MAKIIEESGTRSVTTYCKHTRGMFFKELYKYCPVCGKQIHGEVPTILKRCSNCNKYLVETERRKAFYCAFCGAKFDA